MLGAALKALSQPGLTKAEIQRLRNVVNAAKVYQKLFREYLKHQKLVETEKRG